MRDELARHDRLLRAAIEAHDGHVLKSMGDGVLAVFARVGDAVRGGGRRPARAPGRSAARRADGHPHRRGGGARRRLLRADGEPGRAVDERSRTAARSSSRWSTARLLADALPDGVTLVDLGEHRLRDLSQTGAGVPGRRRRACRRSSQPLRSLESYRDESAVAAHVVRGAGAGARRDLVGARAPSRW